MVARSGPLDMTSPTSSKAPQPGGWQLVERRKRKWPDQISKAELRTLTTLTGQMKSAPLFKVTWYTHFSYPPPLALQPVEPYEMDVLLAAILAELADYNVGSLARFVQPLKLSVWQTRSSPPSACRLILGTSFSHAWAVL